MIQKIAQSFAALAGVGRRVEQFVEVREALARFLGAFVFEHLAVAGALQNIGQRIRNRAGIELPGQLRHHAMERRESRFGAAGKSVRFEHLFE